MERRNKAAYIAAIEGLSKFVSRIKSVMCDYEDPLRSAITQVIPNAELRGCMFHFAKAVLKKARSISLIQRGSQDSRDVVQMAMCLPLLPVEYIEEGITIIRSMLTCQKGKTFGDYISSQWRNKNISVFKLQHRTNNAVESYHRHFNRIVGNAHPNIWAFLANLKSSDFLKSVDLGRLILGTGGAKAEKKKDRMKNAKILKEQNAFQEKGNVAEFLKKSQKLMGKMTSAFIDDKRPDHHTSAPTNAVKTDALHDHTYCMTINESSSPAETVPVNHDHTYCKRKGSELSSTSNKKYKSD